MMTESFRPATDADIASQHVVFCRAEGRLRLRHGFSWVDPPLAWFAPMARHLLSSDPDRCFVAESDGQVVGFSAAFVRDGVWFLAALFIDPDHQGGGIGRRLFELAVGDGPSRRITITDAIQPVSNAMYARYGLVPTTPMLLFEGEPSIDVPPVLEPSGPRPGELTILDRASYGFARLVDHEYWSRQRRCTVWRRDGVAVAYAYRGAHRIDRAAGWDGPGQRRRTPCAPSWAESAVPRSLCRGLRGTLVEVAVAARLRLVAPPGNLLPVARSARSGQPCGLQLLPILTLVCPSRRRRRRPARECAAVTQPGGASMTQFEAVEAVLRSEFGGILGDGPLDPDQDLLASGVIDSFGLIGLIAALEHKFGIDVVDQDVVPEHFQTLAQLAAFVEAKLSSGGSAGPSDARTAD